MKMIAGIALKNLPSKIMLITYILLSIAVGFLILYSNRLLSILFDHDFLSQDTRVFLPMFLLTASLFLSVFSLGLLNAYLIQKLKWECDAKMKEHYIMKLLKSDYNYFINKEAPGIWSLLSSATSSAANVFQLFVSSISRIVSFVFFGVVVFSVDFYAGIFSIAIMPLYFLATVSVGGAFMQQQQRIMETSRDLTIVAQEAFKNVPVAKTKNAYDFFVMRIMKVQNLIAKLTRRFNVLQQYVGDVTSIIAILAPIAVLFGVIQLSSEQVINTGDIIVLFINIPLFLGGFRNIYALLINYKAFKPGLSHLSELDAIPTEPIGEMDINQFKSLETKNVIVRLGDKMICVPNINIKEGEKVMLSGESGVGKSTLFNILLGLILDYEGDILVNGINLRLINLSSLRRVFGVSLQNTNVLTLTLKENILLGLENVKNIDEVLKLSGLTRQFEEKGSQILNDKVMSGGEKSRLGLAQLLITEPCVMLIDETFSNVDEEMESSIIRKLFEKYPEKTFVCISHRIASKKFFDRVVSFG